MIALPRPQYAVAAKNETPAGVNMPSAVVVSPLVLFSLLDHHIRRKQGNVRAIGALLGTRVGSTMEVHLKNSFAIPHTEAEVGKRKN